MRSFSGDGACAAFDAPSSSAWEQQQQKNEVDVHDGNCGVDVVK